MVSPDALLHQRPKFKHSPNFLEDDLKIGTLKHYNVYGYWGNLQYHLPMSCLIPVI